jgi:hypothetical protein
MEGDEYVPLGNAAQRFRAGRKKILRSMGRREEDVGILEDQGGVWMDKVDQKP